MQQLMTTKSNTQIVSLVQVRTTANRLKLHVNNNPNACESELEEMLISDVEFLAGIKRWN